MYELQYSAKTNLLFNIANNLLHLNIKGFSLTPYELKIVYLCLLAYSRNVRQLERVFCNNVYSNNVHHHEG